ncbi:MAG: hypothetical protein JWP97_2938 [Labilithrix sp.]|nr:hypothetical protein [Labilithrix sp.]
MIRSCLAAAIGLAAALLPGAAGAAGAPDTSYERLEGDLSVAGAVGATFGPRAPRAALDLRLRYLWTAGIFVTYDDGPLLGSAAEPRRALAIGAELRPLFLARWLQGKETGHPRLDLAIDSLGLELGAVFQQPAGESFGSKPGLQAGLGLTIPFFPRASGLVIGLHGGARWSNAMLSGRDAETPSDRSLFGLVTVGWQQAFGGNVVDLGDRAP